MASPKTCLALSQQATNQVRSKVRRRRKQRGSIQSKGGSFQIEPPLLSSLGQTLDASASMNSSTNERVRFRFHLFYQIQGRRSPFWPKGGYPVCLDFMTRQAIAAVSWSGKTDTTCLTTSDTLKIRGAWM
jgi:hypothetical protein